MSGVTGRSIIYDSQLVSKSFIKSNATSGRYHTGPGLPCICQASHRVTMVTTCAYKRGPERKDELDVLSGS